MAFLHASAATKDLFMWPPQEFYNDSWQTVWRLHKVMYGLRSFPSAWQNHLAQILQGLNMTRLGSPTHTRQTMDQHTFLCTLTTYCLLDKTISSMTRSAIQKQLMLRPTGELSMEQTISFLGRISPTKVITTQLASTRHTPQQCWKKQARQHVRQQQLQGRQQIKQANDTNDKIPVDKEEHSLYGRNAGKLQRMTYTKPDLSFATKEPSRSLQQQTYLDMKKMKHTLRYLQEQRTTSSYYIRQQFLETKTSQHLMSTSMPQQALQSNISEQQSTPTSDQGHKQFLHCQVQNPSYTE